LLSETFQVLSSVLDRKWLKQGTLFRPADLKVLSAQQLVAKDSLNDLPAQTGVRAKSKVVQLAGSGSLADMQVFLSGAFDGLKNNATSLGETSMVLFYGLANERVYSRIQEGQSAPLVFDYQGPEDVLNRKFCAHLLKQRDAGKRWTREQIDLMDNHQIPDVFVSKGGWRCRHGYRAWHSHDLRRWISLPSSGRGGDFLILRKHETYGSRKLTNACTPLRPPGCSYLPAHMELR
jgi:hypothetical protein